MRIVSLGERDIRAAVTMQDAIDAMRRGLIDLRRDEFEIPVHTKFDDGQFVAMRHRATSSAMVKTLKVNFGRNPSAEGSIVWSEGRRRDHLIADAAAVTTLCTGAVVGVATDLLAAPNAGKLTLIGTTRQSADQIRAVHTVRPLHQLTVVGRNLLSARTLAHKAAPELHGVNITVTTDVEAAVTNADIVCCATTTTEPLFSDASVPSLIHINTMESFYPSMPGLPGGLLANSTIVVDHAESVLDQSGEKPRPLNRGTLTRGSVIELSSALVNLSGHRNSRTIFKQVGGAEQDWLIVKLLADKFLHS